MNSHTNHGQLIRDVAALAGQLLSLSLLGESKERRQRAFEKLYRGEWEIPHTLVVRHAFHEEDGWRGYVPARQLAGELETILRQLDCRGGGCLTNDTLVHHIEHARAAGEKGCETHHVACRWYGNGSLHLRVRQPAHTLQMNELLVRAYPRKPAAQNGDMTYSLGGLH
jgi:hypothetical protein